MNAPVITTTTSLSTKEMEEIADRIRATSFPSAIAW